ncbi:MAG: sigma-70 family RNA polymerase sigma factor [Candidatus Paceibacterota bacterium]|jgi:RNA polymerase sigma-70 factor (ECF subfamily)
MQENPHRIPPTDEELVQLTLQEERRFRSLIERYETKLTRYIRRISSLSEDDVKDVLQETFIKVYRNLNEFDQTLKFSSWIYRIVHNETINVLRKANHFPRALHNEEDNEDIEQFAGTFDLEEEIFKKMEGEKVREAIASLEEKYRNVLILKFLEEKSYEEISDIIKRPIGTVGTLINRAKQQLREKLK